MRHIFAKNGGSLGEPGSVAYLFDKKGVILVDAARYSEDDLLPAVEAGAEDVGLDGDVLEVVTEPTDFQQVRRALEEAGRRDGERRDDLAARRASCRSTRATPRKLMTPDREARGQRRRRRRCTRTSTSPPTSSSASRAERLAPSAS